MEVADVVVVVVVSHVAQRRMKLFVTTWPWLLSLVQRPVVAVDVAAVAGDVAVVAASVAAG